MIDSVQFGDLGSAAPILFLHGFPGVRSKQNREIASLVSATTGRPAIVLLYTGLGDKPGLFSFRSCLAEVHAYFESLIASGLTSLDLVGHSWGGYLALSLLAKFPKFIHRTALLSPLLEFASGPGVVSHFAKMCETNPHLRFAGVSALAEEFGSMEGADRFIRSVSPSANILILQAANDDVTPTAVALSKVSLFTHPPTVELIDTDHSFLTERSRTADRLSTFLD